MELEQRLAKIERANTVIATERKKAEIIVDEFIKSRDFENLLAMAKEEQQIIERQFGEDVGSIAIYITDGIQERWHEGNRLIIDETSKMGIEPQPSFIGERLQAMNCLNQILTEESLKKPTHPPF